MAACEAFGVVAAPGPMKRLMTKEKHVVLTSLQSRLPKKAARRRVA